MADAGGQSAAAFAQLAHDLLVEHGQKVAQALSKLDEAVAIVREASDKVNSSSKALRAAGRMITDSDNSRGMTLGLEAESVDMTTNSAWRMINDVKDELNLDGTKTQTLLRDIDAYIAGLLE